MLEVHLNNPAHQSGFVDSSGITLYHTSELRPYDVGILEIGLEYTDKMAIPPRQPAFDLTGYCISECTRVVSGLFRDTFRVCNRQSVLDGDRG